MSFEIEAGQVYTLGTQTLIVVTCESVSGCLWQCLVIDHTGEAQHEAKLFWYTYSFLKEICQLVT